MLLSFQPKSNNKSFYCCCCGCWLVLNWRMGLVFPLMWLLHSSIGNKKPIQVWEKKLCLGDSKWKKNTHTPHTWKRKEKEDERERTKRKEKEEDIKRDRDKKRSKLMFVWLGMYLLFVLAKYTYLTGIITKSINNRLLLTDVTASASGITYVSQRN